MAPILRKIRAISVSRTARVFVDGGASIGISVIFGLSSLPDGYRFKRPVYRPFKMPRWHLRARRLASHHRPIHQNTARARSSSLNHELEDADPPHQQSDDCRDQHHDGKRVRHRKSRSLRNDDPMSFQTGTASGSSMLAT